MQKLVSVLRLGMVSKKKYVYNIGVKFAYTYRERK